jgi:predicted amidohydrolase YtcJ
MRSNPALWKCLILIASILSALPSSSWPSTVVADSRRTLIRNAALVLTMDAHIGQGDLGIIEKADVLLSGETIAAVGTQLSDGRADVIDATGKFVMPGFVDTHNHLWQSLIRGCGTAQDLNGWLAASKRLRQIFFLEDRAADNITGEVFALRYRASHDTSRSNATRPIGPLPTFSSSSLTFG